MTTPNKIADELEQKHRLWRNIETQMSPAQSHYTPGRAAAMAPHELRACISFYIACSEHLPVILAALRGVTK